MVNTVPKGARRDETARSSRPGLGVVTRSCKSGLMLVIGLALVLGGCTRDDVPSASQRAPSQTLAILERVQEMIGGSVAERRAGQFVSYHQFQDPVSSCMRRRGHEYRPPPFADVYTGINEDDLPLGTGLWFAPLDAEDFGIATAEKRLAPVTTTSKNPGFARLDERGRERYLLDVNRCQPPLSAYQDSYRPSMVEPLQNELLDLMSDVSDSPLMQKFARRYGDCMHNAGFNVSTYPELFEHVYSRFPRRKEAPIDGRRAASNEWIAAATYEHRAAEADARCRRDGHEISMALLAPLLARFTEEHASDIAQVRRDWRKLVAAAMELPGASRYLE